MPNVPLPDDFIIRNELSRRVTSTEQDQNFLFAGAIGLASSNSLIYKSQTFSTATSSELSCPPSGYFRARTTPSATYDAFENGSEHIFRIALTSSVYGASQATVDKWWNNFIYTDVESKVFTLSQINGDDSYSNYWEFRVSSVSLTGSCYRVVGNKIQGPTNSNFTSDLKYLMSWKVGASASNIGQTDGNYTTLFDPLLVSEINFGDSSSPVTLGIDGDDLVFNSMPASLALAFSMSCTMSNLNFPYTMKTFSNDVISTSSYQIVPSQVIVQFVDTSTTYTNPTFSLQLKASNTVVASTTIVGSNAITENFYLSPSRGFSGDANLTLGATYSSTWGGITFSSTGRINVAIIYQKFSNASIGIEDII